MKNGLLPNPKEIKYFDGCLNFDRLEINTVETQIEDCTRAYNEYFGKIYGQNENVEKIMKISLLPDSALKVSEYAIDIKDAPVIRYADREGAFYAMATLLQLIDKAKDGFTVPRVFIKDHPDKDFRAIMVDLARRWHPFETVLSYVDICFLFKIKYLHLHFIDNERYTLPSSHFPDIPKRGESYTIEEINSLTAYAKKRGIVIIPEMELPGHAMQLNKAYPKSFSNKYDCFENNELITEGGAVLNNETIICAGSKETEKAIRLLIDEIERLFPESPYIHIGGDEANIKAWESCAVCRDYMKTNGIGDVYELYCNFVARTASYVLETGRTPIVWEGFPKKGASAVPKETVVIAWESYYHLAPELLAEGFRIINASWEPLYIVPSKCRYWNPVDIFEWNVYTWKHWWNNSQAYKAPITVEQTDGVIGGMLCIWESDFEREIGFVAENVPALAEKTWNVTSIISEDEFTERQNTAYLQAQKVIPTKKV